LGSFPSEVSQLLQYGSRLKALSALPNNNYKLPLEKIEQLMGDLRGCSFNESTALTANSGMYQALNRLKRKSNLGAGAQVYLPTGATNVQTVTPTLRKHSRNVFLNLINAFDRKEVVFQVNPTT